MPLPAIIAVSIDPRRETHLHFTPKCEKKTTPSENILFLPYLCTKCAIFPPKCSQSGPGTVGNELRFSLFFRPRRPKGPPGRPNGTPRAPQSPGSHKASKMVQKVTPKLPKLLRSRVQRSSPLPSSSWSLSSSSSCRRRRVVAVIVVLFVLSSSSFSSSSSSS